jgi:hypothetical protein
VLRNESPSDGLPDYIIGNLITNRKLPKGTNTTRLSVYSPGVFNKITYQGREVSFIGEREFDRNVATSWIDIPSKQERTLTFAVHGKVPMKGGVYRLDLMYQPMVNNDVVSVKISTPGGWTETKPGSVVRNDGDAIVGTFGLDQYSALQLHRKG